MPVRNDNSPLPTQDTVKSPASPVRRFSGTEPTSIQALASLESGGWCLDVGGSVLFLGSKTSDITRGTRVPHLQLLCPAEG